MRVSLLCFILVSIVSIFAYGQTAPATAIPSDATPPASSTRNEFPAEPLVIEQLDHVYTMAADGTGVRQITLVARIQSDAAVRQVGILRIPFAGSSEHVELGHIRVRRPDGSVTETPPTEAIEMPSPVTTAAPFYSDLKELQVPVRNLRVGDRLEWQAKIIRTNPEAPGQFWGQESFITDGVVLSESLELHVPKDTFVNVWSRTGKAVETTTSTEHIYRWESSQKTPTVGPEADAERERKKKEIWTSEQELDEKEGKLPAVAWTTFRSWDAVGAWYRNLQNDRVVPVDPDVQAKVAELTTGKATQQEKVRAVYNYVSTQIRYIGVDFGIGRFQAHRAVEVLQNQYGDCKDKHTLLAAMLHVLGMQPDAVLIGAGLRFNEAVPSPLSFNHLITRVSMEGRTVWLDSTAEVAPFEVLNYALRDKSALAIPDSGTANIERTPTNLPFPSFQKMDTVGSLDETGTSNSRIVITLRGDSEVFVRSAFHAFSPGQYDQLVEKLSQGMGYGGTTSHAEVSRPEDTAEALKIIYEYKREKAGDWGNHKIVPQLAPVILPRPEDKDQLVKSIFLGPPHTEVSTSAMRIPKGWVAILPSAVHVKCPWATYDETYRFEDGTVHAERKIEVLKERVPVADWKSYRKFADDADIGNEEYIQLIPSGAPASLRTSVNGSGAEPRTGLTSDQEADKLIVAGRLSIQHHEFEAAQSQLDKARSLNPEHQRLWANYGYLEFQRGKMSAAISDYKQELSLNPDNYDTYFSLAEAQNILGEEQEAKETLQTWESAEPDKAAPISALVSLLLDEGHASDAVAAAEAGIGHLPEQSKNHEHLQLQLGRAQLAAGVKEKGEATLLGLLHSTTDAGMKNDAAYELAKAGLDLSLTESTAREALNELTTESKTWTVQENPQNTLAKSRRIAATWDTIGWILFGEGKLAEAESYIQAAWVNGADAEIGEHLAKIAEAKGNPDEALRFWELAQATFPSYLRPGVRKTPSATQKELMERIEALRKAGAKESSGNSNLILKQLRTVFLANSGDLVGTAEYRLLLSDGAIRDAQKTSEKEVTGASERMKAAKLPGYWPKGSDAQLVRNATLNCYVDVCELEFQP